MPDARPATVAPFEPRWPCPVCLGVKLSKAHVMSPAGSVTIDHCTRCGGAWMERGEPAQLARHQPEALWASVPRRAGSVRPPCHGCHTPMERDAESCPTCGRRNLLACPACGDEMARRTHDTLVLDVCGKCHGVWFDHHELDQLWRANLGALAQRRSGGAATMADAGGGLLEVLVWSPDLVVVGARVTGHAVIASADALANISAAGAFEATSVAAEAAGEAASSVFEALLEIIGGIFG